jgi:hypothetical protein
MLYEESKIKKVFADYRKAPTSKDGMDLLRRIKSGELEHMFVEHNEDVIADYKVYSQEHDINAIRAKVYVEERRKIRGEILAEIQKTGSVKVVALLSPEVGNTWIG